MTSIQQNTDITFKGGYSEYDIEANQDIELNLFAVEDCDVFIRVHSAKQIQIRSMIQPNVKATILFWNDVKEAISVEETYSVLENANLHLAYGETNPFDMKRIIRVELQGEKANAFVSTASLVSCKKEFLMNVGSYLPNTYGKMENYSVVLSGGKFALNAVGEIVKGAHGSQSHQTSRALTFDEDQTSDIIPTLLIDENDVQASHAMSIGRVDEEQLYYLMSRGLTLAQCTQLISTGYLLPIANTIQNESLQEVLRKELEEKIETLCSM